MTTDTEKLWDAIEAIRTAMLTTVTADGSLDSRPMSAQLDRADRSLWFITSFDTGAAHEIADGAEVNVAFGDTGGRTWASVSGTARVVRDPVKAKALWSPFAEAWLPEGPEASNVALIHVTPSHGTLWDMPSKLVQLFQVAKANVTQTPPDGGEVVHVAL